MITKIFTNILRFFFTSELDVKLEFNLTRVNLFLNRTKHRETRRVS